MKLDRNINPGGRGKYALIKLREDPFPYHHGNQVVTREAAVDYGDTPDTEFFVIRLRDKYAGAALEAYAEAARKDGETEYGIEVWDLAIRAQNHPNKKKPD